MADQLTVIGSTTKSAAGLGNGEITLTPLASVLADNTNYEIHWGGNDSMRVDVPGNTDQTGYLQVYARNGTSAQRWTAAAADPHGYRQLKSSHGMCLTTMDQPNFDVTQTPCGNGSNTGQAWKYESGRLVAENGQSLDVNPSNHHVVSGQPGSSDAQQWGLEEANS
ncbi:RICIN domain-containing protein [Streptomyces sp. NPDC008343]|uniref:RICIN domain-containing protein n=1 Tax=Streptomyces sp. NPDC008343 TaxID=3364828 RepID=UPI0036F069F4